VCGQPLNTHRSGLAIGNIESQRSL
jgi:hypothetical protein